DQRIPSAPPMIPTTRTAAPTAIQRDMRRGEGAYAAAGMVAVDSSRRAKSAAVAGRSAGDFAIACSTAPESCREIVDLTLCSGRADSVITRAISAWVVGAENGGSPASIS